jgi:transposase-like protein
MAKRKTHSAAFKAQVALAAVRGDRTMNQVAAQFGVHPTLIHGWRKKLLAGAAGLFEGGAGPVAPAGADQAELFEQIGRLKMELEWVKKKAAAFV